MDFAVKDLVNGGAVIGMAWVMREIFGFVLKLRKQDKETYKPAEPWRIYVTDKFDDITKQLHNLMVQLEITKSQLIQLQIKLNK